MKKLHEKTSLSLPFKFLKKFRKKYYLFGKKRYELLVIITFPMHSEDECIIKKYSDRVYNIAANKIFCTILDSICIYKTAEKTCVRDFILNFVTRHCANNKVCDFKIYHHAILLIAILKINRIS
ncbi:unnamed protein product [Lasius platythorax]|uniref:Uncharacterized protein n=1 Tax=Lasius platythorax TaxID=488582 RepID=A0AAV2PAS2_9HYME